MSTACSVRGLTAVLLFVVVWPLLQFGLVKAAQVNPWKLFSLAMYCTPSKSMLEVWDETNSRPQPISRDSLGAAARERLDGLRRRWGVLGSLFDASPVAALVFDERPKVNKLLIRLGLRRLDPGSSSFKTTWKTYRFARDSGTTDREEIRAAQAP